MLNAEELHEKYKHRNLMEELSWGYGCIRKGYLRKNDAEFLRWMCSEAYSRIKHLELKEKQNDSN